MASLTDIKVSEEEDVHSVQAEIEALVSQSGWELLNDHTIRKTFHFGTYTKVLVGWIYMATISLVLILEYSRTLTTSWEQGVSPDNTIQ